MESQAGVPAFAADDRAAMQSMWATRSIAERLGILERARPLLAARSDKFADAISPQWSRSRADTLVAEVLPLLEACRFLERYGARILATRRLGRRGLPWWLTGMDAEVQRVPFGRVLVIGPSNYPLFLPGVQALQGLAAGNAVVWKPGAGGRKVAEVFRETMERAGLPAGLLRVTDETVEAVRQALDEGADKVFFTGSVETGQTIGRMLAECATPCVMELSGCDAVVVLASADLGRVVAALAFGMRLNGSATCMAPRRVLLVNATEARRKDLMGWLLSALDRVPGVRLAPAVRQQVDALLGEAVQAGAQVHGAIDAEQQPLLVTGVTPEMRLARADLFAPVLCLMEVADADAAVAANEACPYALTVSIFGEQAEARALSARMTAGSVLLNDLIVPTVDPRVPFGGRRRSGFGVTRGRDGLLEMTAVKVVSVRRNRNVRHYEETTEAHENLFRALIASRHAGSRRQRMLGFVKMAGAARKLKS